MPDPDDDLDPILQLPRMPQGSYPNPNLESMPVWNTDTCTCSVYMQCTCVYTFVHVHVHVHYCIYVHVYTFVHVQFVYSIFYTGLLKIEVCFCYFTSSLPPSPPPSPPLSSAILPTQKSAEEIQTRCCPTSHVPHRPSSLTPSRLHSSPLSPSHSTPLLLCHLLSHTLTSH